MAGPKHQHYIPRFLQRNFLANGQEMLWVYDCANDKYLELHPSNIAVKKNIYTLKSPQLHDQRYAIENALAALEGKASSAFSKLRNEQEIDQQERNAICEYVGMQLVRTPAFVNKIKDWMVRSPKYLVDAFGNELANLPPDEFAKKIAEFEASKELKAGLTQEDFRKGALSDHVRITAPQDIEYEMAVNIGTELALIYSKRKWIVLRPPKGRAFICSDRPVVHMSSLPAASIYDYGPGSPHATNFFPFAKDAALLITTEELRTIIYGRTAEQPLRSLNAMVAINSRHMIFSHSKPLLERLVKRHSLANRDFSDEEQQSDALLRELVRRQFARKDGN